MTNKQLLKELKEGFDLVILKAIDKLDDIETTPEYTTGNNAFKHLQQPKATPKALFKTEDGFDVFEGDFIYSVNVLESNIIKSFILTGGSLFNSIYFKEKANAEKYIEENKKSISFKELEDFLNTDYIGHGWDYGKIEVRRELKAEILNHFKPKQ